MPIPTSSDEKRSLIIPDGVTLMGGRSPTEPGGMLEMSRRTDRKNMLKLGSNTRVTGLRLRGYNQRDRKSRETRRAAIAILGSSGVVVENNEIFGWPHVGVYVAGRARRQGSHAADHEELHPQQRPVRRRIRASDRRGTGSRGSTATSSTTTATTSPATAARARVTSPSSTST